MANMEIAIGLWRESGPHLAPSDAQMLLQTLGQVADVHPGAVAEGHSRVHAVVVFGAAQVTPEVGRLCCTVWLGFKTRTRRLGNFYLGCLQSGSLTNQPRATYQAKCNEPNELPAARKISRLPCLLRMSEVQVMGGQPPFSPSSFSFLALPNPGL